MKRITITKAKLNNNFTQINNEALGAAVRDLKFSSFKVYLYLASNRDGVHWNVNTTAYQKWVGAASAHSANKSFNDGLKELMEKGYARKIPDTEEEYEFSEEPVAGWALKPGLGF